MSRVDTTVCMLQQSIDVVGACVATLEATSSLPLVNTSHARWHRKEHMNQGIESGASTAPMTIVLIADLAVELQFPRTTSSVASGSTS
jgi:hypothetical protein